MEKIYTQEDMDAITDKVRAKLSRELEQLKELNSNLVKANEELSSYKKDNEDYRNKFVEATFKQEFLAVGGNEAAWDDFKRVHGELANTSGEELQSALSSLKEAKPFYFNGGVSLKTNTTYDNEKEVGELFGDEDNGFIEGTIYKKWY